MRWGEAVALTRVLVRDPSSWVAAAMAEWTHPVSRDALVLMDLLDVTRMVNSRKRPKPYPRPWDEPPKRIGTAAMTPQRLRALLDEHRSQDHAAAGVVLDLTKP